MDQHRFDAFTRALAAPRTRRGLMAGLAALAVGARTASAQPDCPIPGQTRNAKGKCSCPAGTDPCPDGCFDKKRDPNNCGTCGNACLAGEICQKGKCVCPAGATCGACVVSSGCGFVECACGACNTTAEGAITCQTTGPCDAPCSTSADCPAGSACFTDTCCGGPVCLPLCGGPTARVAGPTGNRGASNTAP